jgi:signal transduction histidine kinase
MKFWQKAYLITLILFLIAFDALGYILLESSFLLNEEYAIRTARTERNIVGQSVYERIIQLSKYYTELNPDNLKGMVTPYANYYAGQGTYISLFQNGNIVFSNSPASISASEQGEEARMAKSPEGLFCVVGNNLPPPLNGLRLVYIKGVNSLLDFKTDMTRGFILISVVIGFVLSIVLLILLVRLTRPFRRLNAAAVSIAQGDYGNRAPVTGSDEIGEFANSFNVMADKVQEHIQTLSQMSESRERFIDNLSHEMRTPITAILGYGELLKIGNINDEEREKSIDYIIRQSRRIQNMSVKLADLTRLGRGHIEKKPIELASIVLNAQATCKSQLDNKHITLRTDVGGATISGDADLIESLIQNLLENAIKYSFDGGEIDIRTYSENDAATLTVADYGKGMEESEISKVTEPFYRVDKSRSSDDGGIGLGLALCVRICEAHNARFEIKSAPMRGTQIKIHFTTP